MAVPRSRLSVENYLAWAHEHPGRYELHDGVVYPMSPEDAGHAEIKFAVQLALASQLRARRLSCHMLPNGVAVRVDSHTAYEPDALVYCGQEAAPTALEIANPIVVVEVLSPSTRRIDTSAKVTGYFRLPSVAHYLIVDPTQALILHHARGSDDTIVTRIVREGSIKLHPPGLELAVADVYGERS